MMEPNMTHHVMLDLETLGTKPGCPILSIGAVVFNTSQFYLTATNFNAAIEADTQSLMDSPDESTLSWWSEQSEEAREAAFNSPDAQPLQLVLTNFSAWLVSLTQTPEDRIFIWGNGATFDEPILKEAYKRYDLEPVWTFRDSMCFRTLKELGKMLGVKEPEFTGVKHNALCDAAHQAKWADQILLTIQTEPVHR